MSFQPFLALSASAGSGKTFALSVRYLALLFLGESPSAILAATFTNKAAAEMRQRVVRSLKHLGEDAGFLAELSRVTGFSEEELKARAPGVLERFLAGSPSIVTLDSFFVSVLRSGALEIGLEPDFSTREETGEALERAFLEEVERAGLMGSLVQLALQMQKRRAGEMLEGMEALYRLDPLLPGTRYLPADPGELEEPIDALREEILTRLQRAEAAPRALANFLPMPVSELAAKNLFEKASLFDHSFYKKALENDPSIDALYQRLRALVAEWMGRRERTVLAHLMELYDHYRNARIARARQSGILSFDDLAAFTYRLLYEAISRDFLTFRLDSRYHHILLDEFQDTSTLQFLLLKPLIDEIFAGKGQEEFRSFFYVGDTKQSLYRFRGGVEELFDWVARRYGIPVENLARNYRSHRRIVEWVNARFEGVMPGYVRQIPHREEEGLVRVRESEAPVEAAVEEALRFMEAGVPPESIAFLVSTNKDGSTLQEACLEAGIPTRLQTSSSLRQHPRIAALTAMVRYLQRGEPLDAAALLERTGRRLEELDLAWYRPWMSPLALLDRLVRLFGYFEEDPNILRLLDFAAGYETVEEFLEEFELSRISVADRTLTGARILTVHGSKGLEFDYVVVMDKLTRPNADRDPFLFHYDEDLRVDRILYRIQRRERFDAEYAAVMEERKARAEKDRLNVLYVALTRAVKGMAVVRKPKDSLFAPLAMEPGEFGRLEPGERGEAPPAPPPAEPVLLRSYGRQERPPEPEEDEEGSYAARLFGTALHYALEMLGAFRPEALPAALSALRNRYGTLLEEEELEEIARRLERLLESEAWRERIAGAVLHREQPLAWRGGFRQIDLLAEWPDRLLVVDYKSSRLREEKHREQVAEYVEAMRAISGKPVEGMILYLLESGVEMVDI